MRTALATPHPADSLQPPTPELLCFAGHDAGILAEHLPAGMVLVRNEAGTSHAPAEHVELADAAAAATALAHALERLA